MFTEALAALTNSVSLAEIAWRNREYDGEYSALASAERKGDAAEERLANDIGREKAQCVRRALVLAACADRHRDTNEEIAKQATHLDEGYTLTFIREGWH